VTPKERVRQAFKPYDDVVMGDPGGHGPDEKAVLDLVRAAIAEEREACAKGIEEAGRTHWGNCDEQIKDFAADLAAAIRALG
jgi:hypothetical protein